MLKQYREYLTAFLVIVVSLVLLGALTFALGGKALQAPKMMLYLEIPDITGIGKNSEVRYAGERIGRVMDIEFLPRATQIQRIQSGLPANRIKLTLGLFSGSYEIPKDAVGRLASETMLGEKFLALIPLSDEGEEILKDGDTLFGEAPVQMDDVLRAVEPMLEEVREILAEARNQVNEVSDQVQTLLANGTRAVTHLETETSLLMAETRGLVSDFGERYPDLMDRLSHVATSSEGTLREVDGAIADGREFFQHLNLWIETNRPALETVVTEFRVTAQNMKVLSTYIKLLSATLSQKPSRMIWGGANKNIPSEESILTNSQPVRIESYLPE